MVDLILTHGQQTKSGAKWGLNADKNFVANEDFAKTLDTIGLSSGQRKVTQFQLVDTIINTRSYFLNTCTSVHSCCRSS